MGKRITHEMYVERLKDKNPNIEVLEEYNGYNTKIKHRCKLDGYIWNATPGNVLGGKGCPECDRKKRREEHLKTNDEYVTELQSKRPEVISLETYKGSNVKIKHKCLRHDYVWSASPGNVLNGNGCPLCKSEKIILSKTKTTDKYVKELEDKNISVIPLEDYKGAKTKIMHKCLKHDVEWSAMPTNVLRGAGCPKCWVEKIRKQRAKTQDEYVKEVNKINPHIEVIGEYINAKTPIMHHCLKHNVYWSTMPESILNGSGCPTCGIEKMTKSHEQYVLDVARVNPYIEVIGEYKDSGIPILHKCKKDGYEWMAEPHMILVGHGCPVCYETNGERMVRRFLEDNNIEYEVQKRFNDCREEKPLPFDFYLPEYNSIIEYDGEHHYFPIDFSGYGKEWAEQYFEKTIMHDEIKNEYCKKNNIHLLRIPYFADIESELQKFLFA